MIHTEDPAYPMQLRAYSRAGESNFIEGNQVKLLQDGPAVYAAWLKEIDKASHSIFLENYIIHYDTIGGQFVDALIRKAKAGVRVFVQYDWLGTLGTSQEVWRRLEQAGAIVRAFNPPKLTNSLIIYQRNHSKLLCIDGKVGFVGGLCIGDAWTGDKELDIAPWRDTAIQIEGPGALALCHAFNATWSLCGEPLSEESFPPFSVRDWEVGASVQVVRGLPGLARIYRSLQAAFATASSRIWITDAYFILPAPLYEGLVTAARDGVDVRVLVPRHSDLGLVSWVSRSGYSGLLKEGVRIFEWEGPMLHAKTSVVDSRWSRIGSSNMNAASFFSNCELDVITDDLGFAKQMEESFLRDLKNANELVLSSTSRKGQRILKNGSISKQEDPVEILLAPTPAAKIRRTQKAKAAVARAGAAVLGIALRRPFQQSAWSTSTVVALVLLGLGILGTINSRILGIPLTLVCLWLGVGYCLESIAKWRERKRAPYHARQTRFAGEEREEPEVTG